MMSSRHSQAGLPDSAATLAGSPLFGDQAAGSRSVLYVYDNENWAIHNVGRLWLASMPGVRATFKSEDEISRVDVLSHDLVWFGFLWPYLRACNRRLVRAKDLKRVIVSIHDPVELFPQRPDWKSVDITLRGCRQTGLRSWFALRMLTSLTTVVTSQEMKTALHRFGLSPLVLPTMSMLPVTAAPGPPGEKLVVTAVFQDSPRKNRALFEEIRKVCELTLPVTFRLKVGREIWEEGRYSEFLGESDLYLCTSFQEGGPLPAMDAMARGAVVLTTPVGQTQEIVEDGTTGFICTSADQFVERIAELNSDHDRLLHMKQASLARYSAVRNETLIRDAVTDAVAVTVQRTMSGQSARFESWWIWRVGLWAVAIADRVSRLRVPGPRGTRADEPESR